MKKYILTLFLFTFVLCFTQNAHPQARLQLDDSMCNEDEYTLISSIPATQKPAWKRHYEYVGARILSAFLAMHKYASESYSSFKRFFMRHILRRQLEIQQIRNKQAASGTTGK